MKKQNVKNIGIVSTIIIIGCIALLFPQMRQMIIKIAEQYFVQRELRGRTILMHFLLIASILGILFIIELNIFILYVQNNCLSRKIVNAALSCKLINNNYLPLIITSVIYFVFYFSVSGMTRDDNIFYQASQSMKLFDFLAGRYTQWTSRLFIEGVIILVLRLPFAVWKIMTGICLAIIVWTIYYLFFTKEKPIVIWVYCSLIMLCNFYQLSTGAGWVATTLNYIWPLSALCLVFMPVKMIEQNKQSNRGQYALLLPLVLFAANLELYDVVILFISFLLCIKSIYNRKFEYYYYLLFFVSLFMLLFGLTCSGNANRFVSEIKTWYPSFRELSLIQKTALGIVMCFNRLVSTNRLVFIMSSFLFVCIVFSNKENNLVLKIFSLIPFVVSSMIALLNHDFIIKRIAFLQKYFINGRFGGIIQGDTFHSVYQLLSLAIIICILLAYVLSIYIVFKKTKQTVLLYLAVISGFMSSMALSYSPTTYTGSIRTAALLLVSLVVLGTSFFLYLIKERPGGDKLSGFITFLFVDIAFVSIYSQMVSIIQY